jgi:hypothetical protein
VFVLEHLNDCEWGMLSLGTDMRRASRLWELNQYVWFRGKGLGGRVSRG